MQFKLIHKTFFYRDSLLSSKSNRLKDHRESTQEARKRPEKCAPPIYLAPTQKYYKKEDNVFYSYAPTKKNGF